MVNNYLKYLLMNKICKKTVMDTTDPKIIFDENEFQTIINFYDVIKPNWKTGECRFRSHLMRYLQIKSKSNRGNKDFDCIIGLSGGLDK